MEEIIKILLIVCPLIFFAGFIDSIAGGGGLISIPAYLIAGIPTHLALGTNKFVAASGTFVAVINYMKQGKINFKVAIYSVIGSLLGSMIGSKIALLIDEMTLKLILLIILPIVAIIIFNKKILNENGKEVNFSRAKVIVISFLIGFFIGMYDGLFGPGTGTFLIILFTGILGFDLITASGTAKIVNLASNLGSLIVFLFNGKVYYAVAIPAIIFSILGNFIGSKLAIKNGGAVVKKFIYIVCVILILKVLYDFVSML